LEEVGEYVCVGSVCGFSTWEGFVGFEDEEVDGVWHYCGSVGYGGVKLWNLNGTSKEAESEMLQKKGAGRQIRWSKGSINT